MSPARPPAIHAELRLSGGAAALGTHTPYPYPVNKCKGSQADSSFRLSAVLHEGEGRYLLLSPRDRVLTARGPWSVMCLCVLE